MSDNTNNGFPVPEEPLTREEQYLSAIAGVTEATEIPEKPLTRVEAYLNKIVEDGGDITDKLEAGTNIVIEETSDGKAKISASGEVSSEDTYARAEISAILDGASIDSFADVEAALADKVDKVSGKGLSANDFTNELKSKLDGIAAGAEVNVQADWNQTTDTADDYIKNKPTLGTAAAAATSDFATAAQGTKADSAIQGVKVGSTTLTPDSGKAVTITKNDITGLGIPAQDTTYVFEGTYNASTNKAATMADIKDGILTGYAQTSGNVAATDKVIEAIGKVEKKADDNKNNILTVANYGGGINKLNPVPMFTSGQYAVYNATTNTYSETAGHLDTYSNLRFMIQACTGTTASDMTVVSTLVNSNITQNGTPAWLFTKLSTFDKLYVGNNGSQTDCKFFFDVSNLKDNQKYYLCVNITNYTHANNEPFTWKNVMVLSEDDYLSGLWEIYQPYAFSNATITPALIECVDSGKKNVLNTQGATISSASGVTVTRNSDGTFSINRSTSGSVSNNYALVYINAGSYMLSGAPAGGSNEQWILDIRTNESEPVVVGGQDAGSGAKVTIPTSDYYRLTFRLGSSYSGTKTFKPMLCDESLWDVSHNYVPYALDNAELTAKEKANENNISLLYNSGQKNHLSINTSTYTASGSNRALKIPVDNISGTIHIYFGEITSTDTDDTTCGVLLVDANDNTIQTIQFGRGANKDMSVYVGSTAVASVSIYPATNWTNSADDTVSITNGMICSQEAWGATGGSYEPYAMSNADITAWIIAHS